MINNKCLLMIGSQIKYYHVVKIRRVKSPNALYSQGGESETMFRVVEINSYENVDNRIN